jgi:antagonist of KipI
VIVIRRAPAYATIQDRGRTGYMSSGVPRAGAMDLPALDTLNALVGNPLDSAAIECALTGGELELTDRVTFAIAGAGAVAKLNDREIDAYRAHTSRPGDVFTFDAISSGRFVYIAFAGGIDVPVVMGSRSTYVPGGFGGFEGRRLKNGDVVKVGSSSRARHHIADPLPLRLRPQRKSDPIRFIPRGISDELTLSEWTLSSSSDRTGYRLAGQAVIGGASITSEPVCQGVIQLPPGGEPIILMSDAPTVGGYRILGTVISVDVGRLAQMTPGEPVSFETISIEKAQRELADENERIDQIREWTLG